MKAIRWIVSAMVIASLTVAAHAVPVLGTAVDEAYYTGSRDIVDGHLTGNGVYADSFVISWTITEAGGVFHYAYELSGLDQDLSHIIIQVSDNFTEEDIWNATQDSADGDPQTYSPSDPGNSNPGLPNSIFGIKFSGGDGDTYTVEFDSDRAPMWGNFYAKDGRQPGTTNVNYAYNDGLANLTSEDILDFIAVPDTVGDGDDEEPVIPEPMTLGMVGIGLGLVGMLRRRRIA
jgi:hypothetical protein